ncbi:DUF4131 domain-containing protein [Sulfitobacter sp.]|uniref:DUF4131 domain-containing protein n=1 Tax=Sulfitobacter sp. TaxID=1903071 RepID=UPI003002A8F0
MGAASAFAEKMRAERGTLFGWVPVCLAFGIGGYFPWDSNLRRSIWLLSGFFHLLARLLPEPVRPFAVAGMLVSVGVLLAAGRAHSVAGPVLDFRYYGAVEGRIIAIDRSQSDALRLTLDDVVLDWVPPGRTPQRVRLSLHGDRSVDIAAEPGLRVMLTGHLSPPSGPVEPGGFDFQRHAWFVRLGAVGYAHTPLMGVAEPQGGGLVYSSCAWRLLPVFSRCWAETLAGSPRLSQREIGLPSVRLLSTLCARAIWRICWRSRGCTWA